MISNASSNAAGSSISKTPILIFVGVCVAALTLSMVYQRITQPFLDIRTIKASQAPDQGPMSEITGLMGQIEKNPNDIESLRALGNAFMHMKSWDQAIMFWGRVLVLEPQDTMALNQQGVAQFQKQDYEGAARSFEQLLAVDTGNVYALFNIGVLYRHFLGDEERGVEYLRKIVALKPEDKDVLRAVMEELNSVDSGEEKEDGEK